MTFSALFLAALGGMTEAIAGKTIDGGPALARRVKLLGMVERQPAGAAEQAVSAAVEAARSEVVDLYAFTEEALLPGEVADLLRLLNHPPFAQEVAQTLLLRGQPDFERLRAIYTGQGAQRGEGRGEGRGERWTRLEPYLAEFFSAIEGHLTADPTLGPLLRESRLLAVQLRMAEDTAALAAAGQRMIEFQARAADAGEESAAGIAGLLAAAGRQEATLAEIAQLLADWQTAIHQPGQTVQGNQINVTGSAGAIIAGNVERYYAAPPDPAEQRAVEAEERYLRLLRRECNRLPLAEEVRDPEGRGRGRAELVNVYVDLQTESRPSLEQIFDRLAVPAKERPALARQLRQKDRPESGRGAEEMGDLLALPSDRDEWKKHPLRPYAGDDDALGRALDPLTALEALAAQPHTVLLGHPGGGKSTFVNHLAYVLAGASLGAESDWRAATHNAFAAPPFPLRVILRRWSAGLDSSSRAGLPLVYAALAAATGLEQAALERRLARPDCLVLFDGLDEAPSANPDNPAAPDRRRLIVESVQSFCTAHPTCHVLVTSRVKPYEQGSVRLEGLPVYRLAELDDSRVRRFVANWYAELARIDPERAERAARAEDRLQRALGSRPALREMAGTPLLLTMLAAVNTWAGLPESRAELYDRCVEQLLWEWEKKEQTGPGDDATERPALGLVDLLRAEGVALQRADVERVLWELTFHAHEQSGAETADLPADALRKGLAAIHPKANGGWAWANRVVGLMRERGGLLVESEPDVFTFPHRSFQEYLAARWLLTQPGRAAEAARLAESDSWREVVLLACGYLTWQGWQEEAQALIAQVTDGERFTTGESRQRLLTGGMAWLEYNSPPRATGPIGRLLSQAIPPKLTALMQQQDAPPAQRLEAGLLLADTFDRLSTGLGDLPPELDALVPIAAADALGYDFRISKYPITNTQYRRFVNAGGYDQKREWWSKEAIDEILSFQKIFADGKWPDGPRLWDDEGYNKSTQPVVGVSWYEAVAYCAWLTAELREEGEIGQNEVVRLPREEEWMFVASPPPTPPSNSPRSGGRAVGSGDGGRVYAWGDEFAAWRVNAKESGYGWPTPVHMHPGGATPETGVWDLCGNVWEWGLDDRSSGKMLLGGAYWNDAGDVRASSRGGHSPGSRYDDVGFRCVVVPGSR